MQDHDFTSRSRDGSKPYYYVFIRGDAPVGQTESRFFRFDTAREAAALYQFLQVEHPDYDLSLGIHKDYTRRADIIERIDGTNVLSDSLETTSPWKGNPAVAKDAADLATHLNVAWKIDQELVGRPILVPNERKWESAPSYLEGKTLRPDTLEDPKSSIREVSVRGLGWMTLDGLKSHASSCDHGNSRKPPVVGELLVAYQAVDRNGHGFMTITPGEYRLLERQYLTQQQEREASRLRQPLGDLKQEAKTRVQGRPRPAIKPAKPFDHAL